MQVHQVSSNADVAAAAAAVAATTSAAALVEVVVASQCEANKVDDHHLCQW